MNLLLSGCLTAAATLFGDSARAALTFVVAVNVFNALLAVVAIMAIIARYNRPSGGYGIAAGLPRGEAGGR